MSDTKIAFSWCGRGLIEHHNISPVALKPVKSDSFGLTEPKAALENPTGYSMVIQGDNAPVLRTLAAGKYRLKHQVDLLLWDPPYNTGNNDFVYKDDFYLNRKQREEWKAKANLPENAELWVTEKHASRHSLWLSFMQVRLQLAKKLMKESGVIAVHISYHELFRLGMLMDDIFGEENRLGIINWECAYSPKNDNTGIPSTTDYILIYAKDREHAFRGVIPRTAEMEERYSAPDGDKRPWSSGDLSAASGTADYRYGIENPFTGEIHFPPEGSFWRTPKSGACQTLFRWGVRYQIDAKGNCTVCPGENRNNATRIFQAGPWPEIYFLGKDGSGRPRKKRYRDQIKNEGRVLGTYWEADEILDQKEQFSLALSHEKSGHNDAAKKLMKAVLGDKCIFDTPKPLKLTERLVQMFCPKDGVVLDAFGGSGTTGHAVLSINAQDGGNRKFILIERGDYCNSITAERIRRVISGKWASPKPDTKPLPGSFVFIKEHGKIDRDTILEAQRSDLEDIILTSHKGSSEEVGRDYIIGRTSAGEGIALVWEADGKKGATSRLTMDVYKRIMQEALGMGLKTPVYIYASSNEGPSGSKAYVFHQIPDEILAALEIAA